MRRQRSGEMDLSRVDSMIAVRMRVTGHDQEQVKAALLERSPGIRPASEQGRNWNDYAERTARYAFGPGGDRQMSNLSKYQDQWLKLEGRETTQELAMRQTQELALKQAQEQTLKLERSRGLGMSR